LANSVFRLSPCRNATYDKKKNEFASLPRFLSRGAQTEIGGKEWKLAEVTMPHCHLANLYQESAFDGGIRRKTEASGGKLYRHVANS